MGKCGTVNKGKGFFLKNLNIKTIFCNEIQYKSYQGISHASVGQADVGYVSI